MDTKLLDKYIKELNEELDKCTWKTTRPTMTQNFIASCCSKEIRRAEELRDAVKSIKEYGLKNVGYYLQAEIHVSECKASIEFNFSDNVPQFDDDDLDTGEYLLRRTTNKILDFLRSKGMDVTFEMKDESQYDAFLNAIKYMFESTEAEIDAIDDIAKVVVEDEGEVEM